MKRRKMQKLLLEKIESFEGELPSSKDYIAQEYLQKDGYATIEFGE